MFVQCTNCYVFNAANDFHNFNTQSSSVVNNMPRAAGVRMPLSTTQKTMPSCAQPNQSRQPSHGTGEIHATFAAA